MSAEPRRLADLLYVPESHIHRQDTNSYSRQMVEVCRQAGLEVVPLTIDSLPALLHRLRRRRRTLALVSWLENDLLNRAGRLTLGRTLKYLRTLLTLRLLATVVLYVRHNRYPHKAREFDQPKIKRIVYWATRTLTDRVITHDPGGDSGYCYLPHPIYPVSPKLTTKHSDHVICFGRITPYKSLENLIDSWNSRRPLLIAGRAPSEKYLNSLRVRAIGKNVIFDTVERSDDEAAELISSCAASVVAHSPPSLIVSGSIYFSLSCGVPVVVVGLSHAERLIDQAMPGVHFIPSLHQLDRVDWTAVSAVDRQAIYDTAHRRFGIESVAAQLRTLLKTLR